MINKIFNKLKRIIKVDNESLGKKEFYRDIQTSRIKQENYIDGLDKEFDTFYKEGGVTGGFAITETAIKSFLYNLFFHKQNKYEILEFGGGQSTLFWNQYNLKNLFITTFEHDKFWFNELKEKLTSNQINLKHMPLKQINDSIRNNMFENINDVENLYIQNSTLIDDSESSNTRIKNAFYSWEKLDRKIDGIVLDGPHGNGRSLLFPLIKDYIKVGTVILLDDYNHYPFLDDLRNIADFEIIQERVYNYSNKAWIVLEIINIKK